MRLLDLFCGAGGAAVGYARAGFDVVGVDLRPQPNFPYEFYQGDAIEWLCSEGFAEFDVIHASPPCQGYSTQTQFRRQHRRLIAPVRTLLEESGRPWVIENVPGAGHELPGAITLCGSMFGLDVRRHRYFASNLPLTAPRCQHHRQTPRFRSLNIANVRAGKLASVVGVHGHINYVGEFPIRQRAMDIDWMTNDELVESIPPAYTEYVGGQIMSHLATTSHDADSHLANSQVR